MRISAVLVTRGDVDLSPVLATLTHFDEVIVHDNSEDQDFKVYGRYRAAKQARNSTVYTQDDDATTSPELVAHEYRPGHITANMPPDRRDFYGDGIALIGWGSVFDKDLTSCFTKYFKRWPMDDLFLREADRVFTGLNRLKLIDVPFQHLPCAHGSDRMGAETRHLADLYEIRQRIYQLR